MFEKELPDGIYAAALTPLRSDLAIDSGKLAAHCLDLIENGCTGVVLFGTMGEGASFSVPEKIEALEEIVMLGVDPKKVLLGNGSSSIADTIELGQKALKIGCRTYLIAPPSFYKNISLEGVLAFYRGVIQKIADPHLLMILYHIPQYSGVPLSIEVIETLQKEFPEIVIGMKESEGNLPLTKAILKAFPNFKVFIGNEKQIIEAVHLGAAGAICGMANLYPKFICSLYEQGRKENSPNPPAIDAIFQALAGIPFIPAVKVLLEAKRKENW